MMGLSDIRSPLESTIRRSFEGMADLEIRIRQRKAGAGEEVPGQRREQAPVSTSENGRIVHFPAR
jgi:hypothetical protein